MESIKARGMDVFYEEYVLNYQIPATDHKYTCDFVLGNGILVETKGIFDIDDRKKHVLIREQYPDLDVRFVFSNWNAKIRKGSKTSYKMWCEKNGIKCANKEIPLSWYKEKPRPIPSCLVRKEERINGKDKNKTKT